MLIRTASVSASFAKNKQVPDNGFILQADADSGGPDGVPAFLKRKVMPNPVYAPLNCIPIGALGNDNLWFTALGGIGWGRDTVHPAPSLLPTPLPSHQYMSLANDHASESFGLYNNFTRACDLPFSNVTNFSASSWRGHESRAIPSAYLLARAAAAAASLAEVFASSASLVRKATSTWVSRIPSKSPVNPNIRTRAEIFAILFLRDSGLIQSVNSVTVSPTTPTKTTKADPYDHNAPEERDASHKQSDNSQSGLGMSKV
jgi:hypothetical protein